MASGATEAADGAMSGAVHGGPSLAARAVSGNPLAGRRPYESRMRTATASLSSGEIRLLALPRTFAAAMQWMSATCTRPTQLPLPARTGRDRRYLQANTP